MLSPQTQAILKVMFPVGIRYGNPPRLDDFFDEIEHEYSSLLDNIFNGGVSSRTLMDFAKSYGIPPYPFIKIANRCYRG